MDSGISVFIIEFRDRPGTTMLSMHRLSVSEAEASAKARFARWGVTKVTEKPRSL
jgi:hypothetical protein